MVRFFDYTYVVRGDNKLDDQSLTRALLLEFL